MKQISGRMSGTEIQIEMEIQALRQRVSALEAELQGLRRALADGTTIRAEPEARP